MAFMWSAILVLSLAGHISGCDVEISTQLSIHDCTGDFGCYEGNNSMWVRNGCRGVFKCNGAENVICASPDHAYNYCSCTSAPSPPPPIRHTKYMLLDDRNIVSSEGSRLVLGTVQKHPVGAMIKEERDYEMRFDNMQPNVWYDPQVKKWRAWYSTFTTCGDQDPHKVPCCDNRPAQCGSFVAANGADRGTGLLYAESNDGITWSKPDLNMTIWKGSKANNIITLDSLTTGIYLDEYETDPSKRYKITTGTNGKVGVATSADGIHWDNVKGLEKEILARLDTPKNIVWDSVGKQWIMYVRSTPTVSESEGGRIRIQSYTHSLSEDFLGDWAQARPTGLNSSKDYQPDGLLAFPYEGIYLGIGNVFNPTQEDGSAAARGQVNMVLGWSIDGRRWKWLVPNDSLLPLGKAGDFDACSVFAAKQDPLKTAVNDKMRLYYTGCNGPFFGSRGCAMGLATLQRDHFAGYQSGTVVTVPVFLEGHTLKLSVNGGKLGVRVGIVGDSNLSVENCDPIHGSVTDATVSWKGASDLIKYLNGAISLEIRIPEDATVFAFSIGNWEQEQMMV